MWKKYITKWSLAQEFRVNIQNSINRIHHINKLKEKKTTISVDSEKALDKNQHPFRQKLAAKQKGKGTSST